MEENIEQNENEEVINRVKRFLQEGCGCARGPNGGPCSGYFSEETVMSNLNNCLELSSAELDLVILANIQAFTRIDHIGDKRNGSPRCNFLFQSLTMCKDTFLNPYGLSYSRFRPLKEHFENYGISPRTYGNCKRLPSNTLPTTVVEDVKSFLTNYVEENSISLPGRVPGYKSDDIKLLSASETKMSVWHDFVAACTASEKQAVSYSKFKDLWEQFHPDVVVAKPMTDLCVICKQNTSKLVRLTNLADGEKSECVRTQQEHLQSWTKVLGQIYI